MTRNELNSRRPARKINTGDVITCSMGYTNTVTGVRTGPGVRMLIIDCADGSKLYVSRSERFAVA